MFSNRGYTLVELIVVMGVLAVLVGMVLVAINPVKVIQDTRDARNRTEMNQLRTALQLYFNDNNSYPPSNPPTELVTGDYAKALPSVTTAAGFSYGSPAPNTDYDMVVDMNNVTAEDASTVTKCSPDLSGGANANSYMVCPD